MCLDFGPFEVVHTEDAISSLNLLVYLVVSIPSDWIRRTGLGACGLHVPSIYAAPDITGVMTRCSYILTP